MRKKKPLLMQLQFRISTSILAEITTHIYKSDLNSKNSINVRSRINFLSISQSNFIKKDRIGRYKHSATLERVLDKFIRPLMFRFLHVYINSNSCLNIVLCRLLLKFKA